jgi:hypothetical protein
VKIEDLTLGNQSIVDATCDYCGRHYTKNYQDYIRITGHHNGKLICKDCYNKLYGKKRIKNVALSRKKDIGFVRKTIIDAGLIPNFKDEDYERSSSHINVLTQEGYKISTTYSAVLSGYKPFFVAVSNPYTVENIKLWLKLNTCGYQLLSTKYTGNHKKITLLCDKGHEFDITWAHLQSGRRCPCCQESNNETIVREWLDKHSVTFSAQYTFDDLVSDIGRRLRFDFAIFNKSNKLIKLIEVQGEQHTQPVDFAGKGKQWAADQFKETQHRDKLKVDYCKEHNIPLLHISYMEFSILDEILTKEILGGESVGHS